MVRFQSDMQSSCVREVSRPFPVLRGQAPSPPRTRAHPTPTRQPTVQPTSATAPTPPRQPTPQPTRPSRTFAADTTPSSGQRGCRTTPLEVCGRHIDILRSMCLRQITSGFGCGPCRWRSNTRVVTPIGLDDDMTNADRRLTMIATGQLATFSRRQAHDVGVSDRQLRRRVQSGILIKSGPNGFRSAMSPISPLTSSTDVPRHRRPGVDTRPSRAALLGFDGYVVRDPSTCSFLVPTPHPRGRPPAPDGPTRTDRSLRDRRTARNERRPHDRRTGAGGRSR